MNDNLRRYCAIQKALKSLRPTEPKGNVARHLNTLAMLIAGIVGSRKCHLPAVAQKVPSGSKPQSRVRKMERWLTNKTRDHATYYLPYVQTLLANLPPSPLIVVMDGSEAGRDCGLLSVNVVYKKRALPLCGLVVKGKKGHLAEAIHIALVKKVAALVKKVAAFLPQSGVSSSWAMGSLMAVTCLPLSRRWDGTLCVAPPRQIEILARILLVGMELCVSHRQECPSHRSGGAISTDRLASPTGRPDRIACCGVHRCGV